MGSGLAYYGPVLSCPQDYIKTMERIKWDFYWKGKIDKIKRTSICAPNKKGGTGVLDIKLKLRALKMNTFQKYKKTSGKWKYLFEYCLYQASGENKLAWYILENPKTMVSKTQPFFKDLISEFCYSGFNVKHNFSCFNETSNLPLWKNTVITDKQEKELDSKILKPQGIVSLGEILEDSQIISFRRLAEKCNILPINAGRIATGLKRKIKDSYVSEVREGPPNHFLSNVTLVNKKEEVASELSDMNVKIIYSNLIDTNYSPPVTEPFWKNFFKSKALIGIVFGLTMAVGS